VTAAMRRSLVSLGVPNYRRYFAGQVVSVSGNWMQIVAETWLVLKLTHSGVFVGLTSALQFLPILLAGVWGGLLADRIPKRRLLSVTQPLMATPALALWALVVTGAVQVWMVLALVFVRGCVTAFDNPARQAFVIEMVGAERVVNAVSLNSVLVHSSRIIGPALAGGVIALTGVGPCFLVNAATFGVMFIALRRMDPGELEAGRPAAREPGQLRSTLAYVRRTPELLVPLVLMAVVGTLSFNFQVVLPLFAHFTFDGSASVYSALLAAMALGSVGGALVAGARGRISPALISGAALAFGTFMLLTAAAPALPVALALLPLVGAASVTFAAGINSALQLAVDPERRGQIMALYAIVFLGSTPIGGPLLGWVCEAAGPRAGLLLGGVAAVAAGVGARIAFARAEGASAPRERVRASGSAASSAPARTRHGHRSAARPRLPV
jgi:MFS family permease